MDSIKLFRIISIVEGISFLAILLITMPLKYIFNIPEPTSYVGMAHGVLFLLYCLFAVIASIKLQWKFSLLMWALIASLIPWGTFYFEKKVFRDK